jgi:hypothetical protein
MCLWLKLEIAADNLSSAWTSIAVAAGFNVDELHVSQYSLKF